ncbi:MAG: response regulator transcription factor [Candidatus Eisenbacteria bacterium]|uniref:Response regulator transcription factor n=1 Tax=Eiseniibacteriota bacterium TaxID=2212470 RepID=A0A9D6LAU8_UNCEI|nr:response regulator transcription factor [Candidatus Eisenbacteria bacterium]MBI3539249.1 response regulator transcription factor [Candidatus Eisenbacteria bacterium]
MSGGPLGAPRIRLVLAEDHHVVRQALRTLLETEQEFMVAGEASDGLEAVDLVTRIEPDVLVVDLMMPGLGGMEVARQTARRSPRTRVMILSMHMTEAHVLEALRCGVRGYVRKDATASDLVGAIREVARGRTYLSAPFSDQAIEIYRRRAAEAGDDAYDRLTEREREVMHMAIEGLGNSEIGTRLGISPRTAETHRANLMRKLGLGHVTELVRYALRRGMTTMDEGGAGQT